MGYSMEMVKPDGSVATLSRSLKPYGSIVRTDEFLRPMPVDTAELSITYNYSGYFYEAAEDDPRFVVDGENAGIRAIYGKKYWEVMCMLSDMAFRILERYTDENAEKWLDKDVEITTFYDENGNEVDPISCLIRGEDHYRKETHTVTVSEGDTSDYWMTTAANAIKAIEKIMEITVNCEDKDAVWEGD